MTWTCKDLGTAVFQGYATPLEQQTLTQACLKPSPPTSGGLPFTGFDVGSLLTAAIALVVLGLIMRNIVRRSR